MSQLTDQADDPLVADAVFEEADQPIVVDTANNRDKNFTRAKVERRRAQLDEIVARYLSQLDTADRQEPTEALAAKVTRLTEKLTKLNEMAAIVA